MDIREDLINHLQNVTSRGVNPKGYPVGSCKYELEQLEKTVAASALLIVGCLEEIADK